MTTSLPSVPSLEQLKRQAKDLVKLFKANDPNSVQLVLSHLPRVQGLSGEAAVASGLTLSDAQLVIAREHGFQSWPKLKQHVEAAQPDAQAALESFKSAVYTGNTRKLRTLLRTVPGLRDHVNAPLFSFDSPAIRIAAERKDRNLTDLLLKYGADINGKSSWWAGGFGVLDNADPEFAEYLIGRGAEVDIWAAAGLNRINRLAELLDSNPALVNARGGDGQGPLHFAASVEAARMLLDRGAEIDMRDIDHESTPAQWMAVDRPDVCRYLISRGAAIDIFMAVQLGDLELVKRALEEDPESLNARVGQGKFVTRDSNGGHIYVYTLKNGASPLLLAADLDYSTVLQFLLERSSVVDRLIAACQSADETAARRIIDGQPDIVRTLPPDKMRAIADAAWKGKTEAVRLMLKLGFDIEALGDNRSTALNRAAVRGYADLIELLLANGASTEAANEFGGKPLGACIWGAVNFRDPKGDYLASVEKLLAAGSPLSSLNYPCENKPVNAVLKRYLEKMAKTNIIAAIKLGDESRVAGLLDGDPGLIARPTSDLLPLHQAIRSNQHGIAHMLLSRGATLDAKEPSGTTARELAEKAGMLAELTFS